MDGIGMIKAKRIDVLVTDEGEFRTDDIVKIEIGIRPKTYFKTGRITDINTSKITLDCSTRFDSNIRDFKHDDIWHIMKVES